MSEPIEGDGLRRLPVRLAFRAEGDMVVAYYADRHTMRDAIVLGSLRRGLADRAGVFDAWRAFMQRIYCDVVEATLGQRPVFGEPEPAPEHERNGRA